MMHTPEIEQRFLNNNLEKMMLHGKPMYVGRLLAYAATRFADAPALITDKITLSFKQLYHRACAFSQVLQERGIHAEDRVLIFFENSLEFYIAYYAVLQVGAIAIPLNTYLHDRELSHIMHNAAPACLITSTQFQERLRAIVQILTLTQNDMPTPSADHEIAPFAIKDRDPELLAVLLYTSGTTGAPKGVMLSSRNIITNIAQSLARFTPSPGPGDRVFGILPFFHSFAQNICMWMIMFCGSAVIIVPHIDRRNILTYMKFKPTFFLGVPALYALLCMLRTVPVDTVKFFVCGGDALPDRIQAAFSLIYGRRIAVGYGLTEASPVISVVCEDEALPMGTIGRALPGVIARIADEQGNERAQGEIGELIVKGDNIMLGYYNSPEITSNTIKDGWLYTGDLGYIDTCGRVVLTGRIKDLIINKGFNIYPQEIENIIIGYSNVMRVAVVGRKDEQQGEVPVAYVQLKEAEEGVEKKLLALCQQNLAAYKIPRDFFCSTEPLPTTAMGKVDKKKLRN
jgi:long-chain acyl-CoA synthetase